MENEISIVSFNLRQVWKGDGVNSFVHRFGPITEKILSEKPDIVSFQEVKPPLLEFLKRVMSDYSFTGQFRNSDYSGEGVFTAVKRESFEVIGIETIWLSPTPYIAGSRFENQSDCPRICLMTQVRSIKSGGLLRIFNLHLDHISEEARVLGIKCALEFFDQYNKKLRLPSVILGDLNATPDSETVAFTNAHGLLTDVTADIPVTFHNYGDREEKIDYIFTTKELCDNTVSVEAWEDQCNGIYLSDHYPICLKTKI